ncbi:MAG: HAD family hydrolase [Candidatus Aenigmarchaeota archaeon]|nr:HAD family hydrolase [Candidatus Aenigmarchaeota archaeon]
MVIKAIVFDADHTLYDIDVKKAYDLMFSYISHETGLDKVVLKTVWRSHICTILKSDKSQDVNRRKREFVLDMVLNQLDVDKSKIDKLVKSSVDLFWKSVVDNLILKPNTVETISMLKKTDKFVLIVASDEYILPLKMKLNKIFGDWKQYFDYVISSDIAGELKPSVKYYDLVAEKYGLESRDMVFVGDSWVRDLEIPSSMGACTVLLSDKKEGSPTHFIRNISELEKILDVN